VSSFKLDNFNSGTTVVEIRKRNWQKPPFMLVYITLCEEREFVHVYRRLRKQRISI
jgi:hypothetical protein